MITEFTKYFYVHFIYKVTYQNQHHEAITICI